MHAPNSAEEFRRLDAAAEDTEAALDRLLGSVPLAGEIARPPRLLEAMRYVTLRRAASGFARFSSFNERGSLASRAKRPAHGLRARDDPLLFTGP